MADKRSRRDLLTSWLDAFRGASTAVAGEPTVDSAKALRPPGALEPDEAYLEACTGCGDCVPVCPTSTLVMIDVADGKQVAGFHPSVKACYLCTELPCIAACPDGALLHPGHPDRVRMGIARVDPRRCITFKGELCERCFKACPYPHQAIMMIGGRPLVGSGACTGCGLCEYACPEQPKAIVVHAERDVVGGLRIPKVEMLSG